MCSGWSRHTDGRWKHRPGVDAQENLAEARGNVGQAQERRIKQLVQGESWRAEGGAKLMEDALGVHLCTPRAGQAQEDLKDLTAT
jgi:hypothetical protein